MIKNKRLMKIALLCALSFVCTACSRIMGHSVLLWDIPERGLQDGDIVPVYIRSNISHTYAISVPEGKERFDIPLWQITEPESRRAVKKTAARYEAYRHQYASVKLDGLPVRADPVNTARQVYRLRKGEIIKLLYKGKGDPVMAGNTALEGDWMRVLTQDGTQGWCFSYNLEQFATEKGGSIVGGEVAVVEEEDVVIQEVISKTWYPDYYRSMIQSHRIDIARMNAAYCFAVDEESEKITLNLPDMHGSWSYAGALKTGNAEYTFTGTPVKIHIRSDTHIVVTCSDEGGRPRDFNFITLGEEDDVAEIVAAERDRRAAEYRALYNFGPNFKSASYGQLSLRDDMSFTWRNNRSLVPSVISQSARNGGTVEISYFIDDSLASQYDGILTFAFEGMKDKVNFLYEMTDNGIRLEDATGAQFEGNTLVRRGISPFIIFFERN